MFDTTMYQEHASPEDWEWMGSTDRSICGLYQEPACPPESSSSLHVRKDARDDVSVRKLV